jgi:universal stress protein E
MYQKLLVLLRDSTFDQPALQRALTLTSGDTEVLLFDPVYEPALEGYMGNTEIYAPLRNRLVHDRTERARDLVKSVKACGVRCRADVRWARLSPLLLQEVIAAEHPDLVLMTLSSELGWSHGDWQLVLRCPSPILVVQSAGRGKYRHVVAAVDPFHVHAKPAELDLAILESAKRLQSQCEATLTAVHCRPAVDFLGATRTAQDEGRRRVLIDLLEQAHVPAEAASLVDGEAHRVLEGMANSGRADVIVMGALARGRISEFILGHTAERVLDDGAADVLVVKSPSAGT